MTQLTSLPDVVKPAKVIKFPKTGIGPQFVNKVMPWVEQFWHTKHHYPSDVDFAEKFGFTSEQLFILNNSKFWLNCLDRRGIQRPNRDADNLSERQIAAIALITNFHDTRSTFARLQAINVSEEEVNGWYANPAFKRALQERADDVLENVAPDAQAELARQINRGNFAALKFWFEITGRAQSPETLNIKQAMNILIEAVQKHVTDQDTLNAIGDEVARMRAIQGI